MKRTKLKNRKLPKYTKGEELFNMITHIVGGVIGIVCLVLCVVYAVFSKNIYAIVSSIVFGISMILLYTISSIYHGLSPKKETAKKVMQILDHVSIFILIAGTYTPVLLIKVRAYSPNLAWGLFIVVWSFALIGVFLNSIDLKRYSLFSNIYYLLMGWSILVVGKDLITIIGFWAFLLLLIGGIFYTVGVVFYSLGKKKKYFHSIFHILVLFGSLLHFLCILLFII